MTYLSHASTPLGAVTMASDGENLIGLWFDGQKYDRLTLEGEQVQERELPVLDLTKQWLSVYFSGIAPAFTPPLKLTGSAFRQRVGEILLTIPFGHTMTYGAIARLLASERGLSHISAQAVGGAVGHNPISIIVPCHRVIASNGSLTGYAGGLPRKRWLLEHEKVGLPYADSVVEDIISYSGEIYS